MSIDKLDFSSCLPYQITPSVQTWIKSKLEISSPGQETLAIIPDAYFRVLDLMHSSLQKNPRIRRPKFVGIRRNPRQQTYLMKFDQPYNPFVKLTYIPSYNDKNHYEFRISVSEDEEDISRLYKQIFRDSLSNDDSLIISNPKRKSLNGLIVRVKVPKIGLIEPNNWSKPYNPFED